VQGPAGDESVRWLEKEWANVLPVRNDGVLIVGFTWYSLTDQVDWDTALREPNGHVNPLGLYDLDRRVRPVGTAYRELIREWREVLPTQSVILSVPAFPPSRQSDPPVAESARHARHRDAAPSAGDADANAADSTSVVRGATNPTPDAQPSGAGEASA
jgi:hypothetical protein